MSVLSHDDAIQCAVLAVEIMSVRPYSFVFRSDECSAQ